MSNELADLGLDLGVETAVVAETPVVEAPVVAAEVTTEAATTETKEKREEVAIAELEFGFADFIPAQKRGGSSGSKYDFDGLVAPVLKDEADASLGYKYATFTVKPENADDFDADKLKRSVQSAVTAANKASKDVGTVNRYLTRQAIVNGVFVGVTVFRVDATQNTDAAE